MAICRFLLTMSSPWTQLLDIQYLWDQASCNLLGSRHWWTGKGSGHSQATLTHSNLREYPRHTRTLSNEILEKKQIFLYPTVHRPGSTYLISLFACIWEKCLKPQLLHPIRKIMTFRAKELRWYVKELAPHNFYSLSLHSDCLYILKNDTPNWTLHCQWGFTGHQPHFLLLHNTLAKTLQNYIHYFLYSLTFLSGVKQHNAFSVVEEPGVHRKHIPLPALPHSLPSLQVCWNCSWDCTVSRLTETWIINYFPKKVSSLFLCFVLV